MKDIDWDNRFFTRIEIEINHDCNRKCWYCPNSVSERINKGEMEKSTFLTLMTQLQAMNYEGEVSFEFYNEPMLARNFLWFVETCRSSLPKAKLELYTNGTLLTSAMFRTLDKMGINLFVVTKHDGEQRYVFDETYSSLTESEKSKVIYRGFKDLKMTNRGGIIDVGPKPIPVLTPCYIPSFLMVVTHQGNILPCFEDFQEEMVMGNLLKSDLVTIWKSAKFVDLRKKLRQGQRQIMRPCRACNRVEVLPQSSP